jgi:hypothetical protein
VGDVNYGVTAVVGTREIRSPRYSTETEAQEQLQLITDALTSPDPLKLGWLVVRSGKMVETAFITRHAMPGVARSRSRGSLLDRPM